MVKRAAPRDTIARNGENPQTQVIYLQWPLDYSGICALRNRIPRSVLPYFQEVLTQKKKSYQTSDRRLYG